MIYFTPKKFLDMIELNNIKLEHLRNIGIDRSYFIPRYKKGSRKKDEIGDYRKGLRSKTIDKIATLLVEYGYFDDKNQIIYCFRNDDFETMLPKDLL